MQRQREQIGGESQEPVINEKALYINRVSKVVKGGKRMRFSALVVAGDGDGHVGVGMGKATEVPEAIRKGAAHARKTMIDVPRRSNTIPHDIIAKFGASKIMLKPAAPGTGIVASDTMRAVLELAGVKDVVAKSLGSSNRVNVVKATLQALSSLRDPHKEVARRRGTVEASRPKEIAREPVKAKETKPMKEAGANA
jgi:small subunit ribosomal protein S5